MPASPPRLHMMCGKIGSGKSTLAGRLARDTQTVLIAEDAWLAGLYSDQLEQMSDYMRCSQKLRTVMADHVTGLLNAGLSVVLDFPANTVAQRAWMRGILSGTSAAHQLHVLDVPDAVCLARLRERNERSDHPFQVSEAQFHQFSSQYSPPTPEEALTVVRHKIGDADAG